MDTHNPECYVSRLPDEIVVQILLSCPYNNIFSFALTCRKYSNIVSSSTSLELHIELEANGLQTTERSLEHTSGDHVSLLKKLQRHHDAWLDLNIRSSTNHDCNLEDMTFWELRDGVFAKAFIRHTGLGSVLLLPLDSGECRTQVDFDTTFNVLTMDLGQDLITLAGVEPDQWNHGWLRLCSSTTGQAHPQAKKPLLELELGFDVLVDLPFSLTLEIKHDLVAAKFACTSEFVYEILIWNWKTGRLMHRISCDNGVCSFVFMDRNRLIVWSARSGEEKNNLNLVSLVVYEQLGCVGSSYGVPDSGVFNVPSFPTLKPAFTFQFPKLQNDASLEASSPFAYSRALTLGLTMSISGLHSFRIFVDARQLAGHMELAWRRSISELDWDEWGEHATRWFCMRRLTHWICWMFGSRSIFQGEHLSVVDFHTPTVRRHANRRRATYFSSEKSEGLIEKRLNAIRKGYLPDFFEYDISYGHLDESNRATMDENAVIVDCVTSQEPTVISFFEKPVVSRLPYRMVTRVQPPRNHGSWLISGKQLIEINQGPGYITSARKLTVYTIGGSHDEDMNNL
ncbi:hypothetical protein FRC09_000799 [Ceratobasidium sp. 395]|nr:hypothetical protein FRC09_000799 [Ceratobasidium sp. 395]